MIRNREMAREVVDAAFAAMERMTMSARAVNGASAEEVSWYRHALATVYGQIFEQILEPVVKLHPELKPAAWQRDEAARE